MYHPESLGVLALLSEWWNAGYASMPDYNMYACLLVFLISWGLLTVRVSNLLYIPDNHSLHPIVLHYPQILISYNIHGSYRSLSLIHIYPSHITHGVMPYSLRLHRSFNYMRVFHTIMKQEETSQWWESGLFFLMFLTWRNITFSFREKHLRCSKRNRL